MNDDVRRLPPAFMFATGIENSYPTINGGKKLVADWREVLPTQSICLRVPVVSPHDYAEPLQNALEAEAERKQQRAPTESTKTQSGH